MILFIRLFFSCFFQLFSFAVLCFYPFDGYYRMTKKNDCQYCTADYRTQCIICCFRHVNRCTHVKHSLSFSDDKCCFFSLFDSVFCLVFLCDKINLAAEILCHFLCVHMRCNSIFYNQLYRSLF